MDDKGAIWETSKYFKIEMSNPFKRMNKIKFYSFCIRLN